jgi:hypothetical protein
MRPITYLNGTSVGGFPVVYPAEFGPCPATGPPPRRPLPPLKLASSRCIIVPPDEPVRADIFGCSTPPRRRPVYGLAGFDVHGGLAELHPSLVLAMLGGSWPGDGRAWAEVDVFKVKDHFIIGYLRLEAERYVPADVPALLLHLAPVNDLLRGVSELLSAQERQR